MTKIPSVELLEVGSGFTSFYDGFQRRPSINRQAPSNRENR